MRKSKLQIILTKEMLQYHYELYGSIQKMSDALNISVDSIYKYMKLHDIKYSRYFKAIYSCNHNIFSEESERAFYLAGFIAADGCLQDRGPSTKTLKITLSNKDRSHLEKIQLHLDSDHPIFEYTIKPTNLVKTTNKSSEFTIISKQIYEDLSKFNIVPNKTFIYEMPNWLIEHPFVHHFMRGYLDGDGTFSYCGLGPGRTITQMSFSMIGTCNFVTQYMELLSKYCGINKCKISKRKNIWCSGTSGNGNLKAITNFLYKDATLYLDRKYDKVKHLLSI